ncbi:GNAT family N-acetyltransferase [Aquimarina agarilytica]|uniref:GNAT family N-acetyltransferase n=1 Tax=Aquimarina agarilytica TaxID=1087449 RepID=UPI000288C305|nr:GNAT family N-acetyltransferase [Aquimarina agarilytica]
MDIKISTSKKIDLTQIINLYEANKWSAAKKPEILQKALMNSHSVVSAWDNDKLIGLGNAISDNYLVVYYPHLLVLPKYQNMGIGKLLMKKLQKKYMQFHMQMLTADENAIPFYKKMKFETAGNTTPMWIYNGTEHE